MLMASRVQISMAFATSTDPTEEAGMLFQWQEHLAATRRWDKGAHKCLPFAPEFHSERSFLPDGFTPQKQMCDLVPINCPGC